MLYPPLLDGTPLQARFCPGLGISSAASSLEHDPILKLTCLPSESSTTVPPLIELITPVPKLLEAPERHEKSLPPPRTFG